ncbi:amino acid permease [Anoxybacteroides tepidamans]|uniref:amino acid permease n=1 Tax=Anoxybacteroides tepidamans TaxID=265948 RepID=UPI0004842994|nr:amino acid permease [Anoxybacillus tepidamans]
MSCAENKTGKGNMKWWQLSLFGVGCTIGTGFFLGSSIAIKTGGPSVLLAFILAALGTYFVFDVLAKMTAQDPQEGAFRTYAKKAYGRWAGFSSGWTYWCSEMLIMGSQMTALSIFSRFCFPHIPLWVFATGYAILGLAVLLIGVKWLNRLENTFAILKIAAILMFIVIAASSLFGFLGGNRRIVFPDTTNAFFPNGVKGLWSSLIYAFYGFGGIEVLALMATRLRDPKEAPKSGKVMLSVLTTIYVLSIGLAVMMVSWRQFNAKESPFVVALSRYDLPFIPHLFNAILIIAGFSTMAASLFAVTSILVTLAEDGDAPKVFTKRGKLKVPLPALGLTVGGLALSIVMALIMPSRIYEYITTAAGLMLLYNWLFIVVFSPRLIELSTFGQWKRISAIALIMLAVSGTLLTKELRPGFFVSLSFVAIIALVTFVIMRPIWIRRRAINPQ